MEIGQRLFLIMPKETPITTVAAMKVQVLAISMSHRLNKSTANSQLSFYLTTADANRLYIHKIDRALVTPRQKQFISGNLLAVKRG